jgi:hypothetical protein
MTKAVGFREEVYPLPPPTNANQFVGGEPTAILEIKI